MSDVVSGPGKDSLFADSRKEIAADDWEDQDLLTKDEARNRLQESAEMVKAQLADLEPDGDTPQVGELRAQLDRITKVLRTLGG